MVWMFFLGLIIGSFLNVCIYRLPRNMSLVYPNSHCSTCGQRLKLLDLIPLVSFLIAGGKCRYCQSRISWRYPAVEFLCALGFTVLFLYFGFTWQFAAMAVLFCGLLVCSFTDFDFQIIPDEVLLVLALAGIPLSLLQSTAVLLQNVLGALLGGFLLLVLACVFRGGMGGGDIKLTAAIGFYLGWQYILLTIFTASVLCSLTGFIWIKLKNKSIKEAIPFGPFLSVGAVISILWGERVLRWYLNYWQM